MNTVPGGDAATANEAKLRTYLKRATTDLKKAYRRLEEAEARSSEPIAIVSMSCRFPGGATTPERLWELLVEGRDTMGPFPAARGWDVDALYDADPDSPGRTYAREGAFLDDAAGFDAEFFGISPREALAMDPQQRLLLEDVVGGVRARPGIVPESLKGSPSASSPAPDGQDYARLLTDRLPEAFEGVLVTGASDSVASGRVSYTFGLEGPADHPGHGLLVLAGGRTSGGPSPARRGMRARARGRGDGDGHPDHLHRVQPPARARPRRPLQGLRRFRRRRRLGRRRRRPAPGTALRRPPQRPPRTRGRPRFGRQPGRRQQRAHRTERARPATRHPGRAGQRPAGRGRCGRGRSPRHRDHTRGPDRGTGTARHLRTTALR